MLFVAVCLHVDVVVVVIVVVIVFVVVDVVDVVVLAEDLELTCG